jgi:DnaB-like helicase N terminal domain
MSTHDQGHHGRSGVVTPRILPGSRRDDLPTDRLPPHNLEAEEHLLSALVIDPDALPKVRAILRGPDDFYRAFHQEIYHAIADLADRGDGLDGVILWEELRRRGHLTQETQDLTRLGEILQKAPSACNAAYHAAIVRAKAIQRDLIDAAAADLDEAYSQNYTAEQLLERSARRLARIAPAEAADDDLGLAPWPEPPDPRAFHGLAGEVVGLIEPHTEADPTAILGQFLVAVGSLIGRSAHFRVNATRHYTNLFLVIVGNSAHARKGTSWDVVSWLLKAVDPPWHKDRIKSGLASGEGLIWQVRDPIVRREKATSPTGGQGGYHEIEIDPGVDDKRALWVETEFGSTLAILNREGNSLSGWIRKAFDSGDMASETKNNACRATAAHVSIIGHITGPELHHRLTQVDAINGFANRFLWLCARRSKFLAEGGAMHTVDFAPALRRLASVVDFARGRRDAPDGFLVARDRDAMALWREVYPRLNADQLGAAGQAITRAAALTMRLAVIYALLDASALVREVHLRAALALWDYCERSARFIFGDEAGSHPDLKRLLKALREAGAAGLTTTQIRRQVFQGHLKAEKLRGLLARLVRDGLVRGETVRREGGGPPTSVWKSIHDPS